MTRPNFFIIGAPKSGTTAMAGYLGDHPGIHFCEPKEPCFFATDFPGQRLAESEEDYLGQGRRLRLAKGRFGNFIRKRRWRISGLSIRMPGS